MDDFRGGRFLDGGFFEEPLALTLGLGLVPHNHLDQLAALQGHDLGLFRKGRSARHRAGHGRSTRRRRRRGGLCFNVKVEFGLELTEIVLHHALVVAAVVCRRFLSMKE